MVKPLFQIIFMMSVFVGPLHSAQAGARIEFDLEKQTAVIRADLYYFGDVRPQILRKATEIIAKQWQGQPTRVGDDEVTPLYLNFMKPLKISTDIRPMMIESRARALELAMANRLVWVNFIRAEQSVDNAISSEMLAAANMGLFLYADRLDRTTTAAHEFGHGINLNHREDVQGSRGYPPIMMARGGVPNRAEYSYLPLQVGSTVNPIYRRVRQEEVDTVSEMIRGAAEFTPDDSKRLVSPSMVKLVYLNQARTRGYIDIGYWIRVRADDSYFLPTAKARAEH